MILFFKQATPGYTEDMEGITGYTYDAIGNMVGEHSLATSGTATSSTNRKLQVNWDTYGKVTEVIPQNGNTAKRLRFWYDASGNRVVKQVNVAHTRFDSVRTTYYVRDATGNPMGTYEQRNLCSRAIGRN